ncbi:MARCKS-like protein [Trinickia diaoshuihuensis]|uniref:MARCKS-like protein n=1 Tax=Trinickia diaoshuihuensis TaxID=2292265 RepID=UPI000E2842E5|nr:MARCKS-like protein [Trinickia diaoshuihuensis]
MSNAQERERGGQQDEPVQGQPVPGHTENMPVGPDMPQSPGGGAMEDTGPGARPDTKPGTPPGTQSERDRLRGES